MEQTTSLVTKLYDNRSKNVYSLTHTFFRFFEWVTVCRSFTVPTLHFGPLDFGFGCELVIPYGRG